MKCFLLQCNCCELSHVGQLLPTMPDLSIVYKLLSECGQQVNIYDWLVAFSSIVGDNTANDDENEDISQDIQYVPFICFIFASRSILNIHPYYFLYNLIELDLLVRALNFNS